jgi:site-specific recombinase XerD
MHQLRHACATHLLEAGANIRLIAELLGHSDIESTGLYARAQLGELRNVHRRSHPRG